jgi:hypothetical protein
MPRSGGRPPTRLRKVDMVEPDWGALRASLDGAVVLPQTPAYDDVRRSQIVNFWDVRPQAVVLCQMASDVTGVVAPHVEALGSLHRRKGSGRGGVQPPCIGQVELVAVSARRSDGDARGGHG